MSRKLWAPLGVLALVASCLGFGLASSAANASDAYTWTVSVTGCDNGTHDGKFSSTYTNNDTQSHFVTYSYDINGNGGGSGAYGPIVNPGQSVTIHASGVKAATYDWTLIIDNGLVASKQVTMPACPVTPKPGTATASSSVCSPAGAANGEAAVVVTNTVDGTKASETYAVTLGGTAKTLTLADGKSGNVLFTGLTAGSYPWSVVNATDDTNVSGKVMVTQCKPAPLTKITPKAVVFTDKCGTSHDSYTIPSTKGVNYEVSGTVESAGAYTGSGTVAVTAVAQKGYTLEGTTSWSHSFTDKACGSSGGGNGNGNSGSNGSGNGGHHHGHHASHHGHGNGSATGTHSGSSGSTGSSSTASSTSGSGTSGSGAPETGISSESSVVNAVWGYGLIGVAIFGSGVLLWRRPWTTE